jgi:hypothetical protein
MGAWAENLDPGAKSGVSAIRLQTTLDDDVLDDTETHHITDSLPRRPIRRIQQGARSPLRVGSRLWTGPLKTICARDRGWKDQVRPHRA